MTIGQRWVKLFFWSIFLGVRTIAPEENCPRLGLGLVLELGSGAIVQEPFS